MILNPAIIALLVSSVLVAFLVLYSSWYGAKILRYWDLRSGDSLQLDLERRTNLISTILAYVFGFQLFSLFLLVYTGDKLSSLFTGAMCAAGAFKVNSYGYPLLLLKVLNFILAGLWLVLNHADNRAYDYPLTRKKYAFLLALAPLIALEAFLQAGYFLGLRPDVITSCCGSLFSGNAPSVASDISSLPATPMMMVFAVITGLTIVLGVAFTARERGGCPFSLAAAATFLIGIASVLSFISPAVYELPTHHCPFCILQKEYGYVGYLYYAALLGGVVTGTGVGILTPFRKINSFTTVIPPLQKRLAMISVLFTATLALLTVVTVVTSNLRQ